MPAMLDALVTEPAARRALTDAAAWRAVATCVGAAEAPRVARRGRQRRHEHAHRELMLVLTGEVTYGLGDDAWRCTPGTWLVFEAFEPHDDGYADLGRDFTHLWVSLLDDGAFANVWTARGGRLSASPIVALDAADEARRALDDARALSATAPALARARLQAALTVLAARLVASEPAAPADARGDAIDAILRHVARCAGKGVSIEHLARIAGYSPFHFARVFRRRTGRTVHAYVDECRRATYAALRAQGLAHRAIAERLGFSCASAFSRWLRGQRAAGHIAQRRARWLERSAAPPQPDAPRGNRPQRR